GTSAAGSRSVAVRRQEPPPTSRADNASLRMNRPPRSGRASTRSTSAPSARRNVSSFATASGNASASTISPGGRRPRTRPAFPPFACSQAVRPSGPRRGAGAGGPPAGGGAAAAPRGGGPRAFPSFLGRPPRGGTGGGGGGGGKPRPPRGEPTRIGRGRAPPPAASAANRRSAAPTRAS